MITLVPPRPLSSSEQSTAARFQAALTPVAQQWERSTAAACAAAVAESRADRLRARRQHRQQACKAMWKAAAAAPTGLGVIELWIVQWLISQLLNWIMRNWLTEEPDAVDND